MNRTTVLTSLALAVLSVCPSRADRTPEGLPAPVEATLDAAPLTETRVVADRTAEALPDLNKPDPAILQKQRTSAYYVNTVSVLLPAGVKVKVRKDWYSDTILLSYPKNPYTNWRGVSPEAFVFNHEGVVMNIAPSGTRYLPKELTVTVPNAVKVEIR